MKYKVVVKENELSNKDSIKKSFAEKQSAYLDELFYQNILLSKKTRLKRPSLLSILHNRIAEYARPKDESITSTENSSLEFEFLFDVNSKTSLEKLLHNLPYVNIGVWEKPDIKLRIISQRTAGRVLYFLIGCLAISVTILALMFHYFYKTNIIDMNFGKDYQQLSSVVGNACLDNSMNDLVGQWEGIKRYPSGKVQEWINTRRSDGTYSIEFKITQIDGTVDTFNEDGLWSYSNCLYSVVANDLKPKKVYPEIYRVNDISETSFEYTSFRTYDTFVQIKID